MMTNYCRCGWAVSTRSQFCEISNWRVSWFNALEWATETVGCTAYVGRSKLLNRAVHIIWTVTNHCYVQLGVGGSQYARSLPLPLRFPPFRPPSFLLLCHSVSIGTAQRMTRSHCCISVAPQVHLLTLTVCTL